MATINDIFDVEQAFLAAAVAALELTDAGAPPRQIISPGQPALDCCGQVAVWAQTLGETDFQHGQGALAAASRIRSGGLPQLLISIQATRCHLGLKAIEKGDLPSPADITATARIVDQDGWALRNHIAWELRHGALADLCNGVEMLGGEKMIPQGGCVGWGFAYRYPIEGGILA